MSKPIPEGVACEGDMTKALDSRFVNAIVLQGAIEKSDKNYIVVTIDRVEFHESLRYENGTTDKDAYLLYFVKSDKPLRLAKTNIKRICAQHGTVGKGWHGKAIALGLEQDRRPDLGGIKGPCVRVLNIDPKTGKIPTAW